MCGTRRAVQLSQVRSIWFQALRKVQFVVSIFSGLTRLFQSVAVSSHVFEKPGRCKQEIDANRL